MLNFTKISYFKIIALTVAGTLFFESSVYGTELCDAKQLSIRGHFPSESVPYDIRDKHLRVPMASCKERMEEAKGEVLDICVGSHTYGTVGGLENYLKLLYEEIASITNVRIHILYFSEDKKVKSSITRFGPGEIMLHPIYLPSRGLQYLSFKNMFTIIKELADIKRDEKIDLLHLHYLYVPILTLSYVLLKMRGVPMVVTCHGVLEWMLSWSLGISKFSQKG